jgi:predicted ribosomally synthesized peptide with SipW-like signal peptide
MKKSRIISLVLVVAVMLMGAGYAYWQQDLSITNTVDTGDLKVEFVPLLLDEILDDHGSYDNEFPFSENYMDVNMTVASDKLECEFFDVYPGAGGYMKFRIANTGTVPARVTGIEGIVTDGTEEQLDNFDYIVHRLRIYTPKFVTLPVGFDWENLELIYENFEYTDIDLKGRPIHADTFDEFVAELQDKLDQYTLEPYAFFEINGQGSGYDIVLPPEIDDEDGMENLQNLGFDLNITFQQGE